MSYMLLTFLCLYSFKIVFTQKYGIIICAMPFASFSVSREIGHNQDKQGKLGYAPSVIQHQKPEVRSSNLTKQLNGDKKAKEFLISSNPGRSEVIAKGLNMAKPLIAPMNSYERSTFNVAKLGKLDTLSYGPQQKHYLTKEYPKAYINHIIALMKTKKKLFIPKKRHSKNKKGRYEFPGADTSDDDDEQKGEAYDDLGIQGLISRCEADIPDCVTDIDLPAASAEYDESEDEEPITCKKFVTTTPRPPPQN